MSEARSATALSRDELASAVRGSILRWLRKAAKVTTWIYVAGLAGLLLWLEHAGEHFSLTGILLFAPPQVLLLPLVFLTPFCLIIRWRSLGWHVAAVLLVAFGYMNFRWHAPPASQPGELSVVTHNVGQGNRAQFYDFVAKQNPDLVVIQDARGRGQGFARIYRDRYVVGEGEFLLVSRWPIRKSELVRIEERDGRPVAARFELTVRGRAVAIYSVHLPTPRSHLNQFLSGRALSRIFADEASTKGSTSYGQWTSNRLSLARRLAAVFEAEKLPFLACGDFNTPDHGVIYHTFSRVLTDAHLHAGRGWGLTFPGATRNPLSARGPWLRIDYAFAGKGWDPIWCTAEAGRKSQHCAVAARFIPTP